MLLASGHVRWVRASECSFSATAGALLLYLAVACREELAFRGYPLRRIDSGFGLWAAQLVVATIFALEHVVGGYSWFNAVFGAFVGGLFFGMAALATRGLAVPIGMHAAWNFGQWVMGQKDTTGIWRVVVDAGYEARAERIGMVGYLVPVALAIVGFWWWYQRTWADQAFSRRVIP